jgi:hypothetical protein
MVWADAVHHGGTMSAHYHTIIAPDYYCDYLIQNATQHKAGGNA